MSGYKIRRKTRKSLNRMVRLVSEFEKGSFVSSADGKTADLKQRLSDAAEIVKKKGIQ
jgi:hypothetical protein